jgi:hypothetical protein
VAQWARAHGAFVDPRRNGPPLGGGGMMPHNGGGGGGPQGGRGNGPRAPPSHARLEQRMHQLEKGNKRKEM